MFKYVYRQNGRYYCIKFVIAAVIYDTFRGEMKIYTRKLPPPLQVSLNTISCHVIILMLYVELCAMVRVSFVTVVVHSFMNKILAQSELAANV